MKCFSAVFRNGSRSSMYVFTANTVKPTVAFWSRNCSFSRLMSKVPPHTIGASQGVKTRTSFLEGVSTFGWEYLRNSLTAVSVPVKYLGCK